jgi:hypothetical protein
MENDKQQDPNSDFSESAAPKSRLQKISIRANDILVILTVLCLAIFYFAWIVFHEIKIIIRGEEKELRQKSADARARNRQWEKEERRRRKERHAS